MTTTTQPAAPIEAVIYLEVDGRPEPLSNVVWTTWQRCGCMSGVANADQGPDHQLTTEAQARASMRDSRVQIQRSIDDGETHRPMTWETYRALGAWDDCTHLPKWGIPVAQVPEGHVWATTDRWYTGRRSHIKHLVSGPDGDGPVFSRGAALCGHQPSRTSNTWTEDNATVRDSVTCRRCEKRAGL